MINLRQEREGVWRIEDMEARRELLPRKMRAGLMTDRWKRERREREGASGSAGSKTRPTHTLPTGKD